MKTAKILIVIQLLMVCFWTTGCRRSQNEVWEDTKSASRYMGKGMKTLGGKHGDSRQVSSADEFYPDDIYINDEFMPLTDEYGNPMVAVDNARQARETPGDPGSSIPGIDAFRDPSNDPQLSPIFQNVLFEYNSSLVKGQHNLDTVRNIADYLKKHENVYVFIEGHCDERGPEAYNLALGSRRSNAVRNLLIKEGVNPDNLFTISYGRERPLVFGHDEGAWNLNRRAQFKIYTR